MNFRVVVDTNVVIASFKSTGENSPSQEFFKRWKLGEFKLYYSRDMLEEYVEKLLEFGTKQSLIIDFVTSLKKSTLQVFIEHFHFYEYPKDPDDICSLCL